LSYYLNNTNTVLHPFPDILDEPLPEMSPGLELVGDFRSSNFMD